MPLLIVEVASQQQLQLEASIKLLEKKKELLAKKRELERQVGELIDEGSKTATPDNETEPDRNRSRGSSYPSSRRGPKIRDLPIYTGRTVREHQTWV